MAANTWEQTQNVQEEIPNPTDKAAHGTLLGYPLFSHGWGVVGQGQEEVAREQHDMNLQSARFPVQAVLNVAATGLG